MDAASVMKERCAHHSKGMAESATAVRIRQPSVRIGSRSSASICSAASRNARQSNSVRLLEDVWRTEAASTTAEAALAVRSSAGNVSAFFLLLKHREEKRTGGAQEGQTALRERPR